MTKQSQDRPIQYIKGFVEFYKLKFFIDENALIPRPETELLVDEVIKYAKVNKNFTVLDIGTGAGNIAISLAINIKGTKIIATEISPEALLVARKNAKFHQVEDRIEFTISDLLDSLRQDLNPDVIVTNLPYIPTDRINYLDTSVKDFEPHIALDGGQDGFEPYRKLFQQIDQKGWQPKLILGEIDYTHGDIAQEEAKKYFPNSDIQARLDLAHKQRIIVIAQQTPVR